MHLRSDTKRELRSIATRLAGNSPPEHPRSSTYAFVLPQELLLMTFRELYKIDLKSVRLVSRLWNDIASELLFDQIWISHRQKDVEVFNAWTANKRCSSFVKTLLFDASFLDPNMDVSDYVFSLCEQLQEVDPESLDLDDFGNCDPEVRDLFYYLWGGKKLNKREQRATLEHLFEIGRFSRDGDHWTRLSSTPGSRILDFPLLHEGHAVYLKEAMIEREMRVGGELCVHLTRGLERLPRLQTISYREHCHVFSDHFMKPFDPLFCQPMYLSGPPFIRSWGPLYVLPTNRLYGDCIVPRKYALTTFTQEVLAHTIETLLSAICLSRVKVARLEVAGEELHFQPLHGQLMRDSLLSRNMSTVFSSLESLSVHITSSESAYEESDTISEESEPTLGDERFLATQSAFYSSINLIHLELKGCYYYPDDARPAKCVFTSVLPRDLVLTNLRTLKLESFTFEAENLVSFLKGHRLHRLELYRDVIRVTDNDHPAAVRTVCGAISGVPKYKVSLVETMAVADDITDKFLVLKMDDSYTGPVVYLGSKNYDFHWGRTEVGRVVDVDEPWSVTKETHK